MTKERHMRDLGIDEAPGGNRTNIRTTNPLPAGRVRLGKAMENGVEPPEELEPEILLKGKVHQVFAAAGFGKTMLELWLAKRAIERGETVIYLDDENGAGVANR
jgi:hypothetical protein